MLGGYWICLFSSFSLFIINKIAIKREGKRIERGSVQYLPNEIIQILLSTIENDELKIQFSEYYSYNIKENTLRIKKKQTYSEYDRFVCFHELGHYIDYNTRYRRHYCVLTAFRVVFVTLWCAVLSCALLWGLAVPLTYACIIFATIIEVGVGIYIILETAIVECRASKWAIQFLVGTSKEMKAKYGRIAALSVMDQVLFWIIMILPVAFLLCTSLMTLLEVSV